VITIPLGRLAGSISGSAPCPSSIQETLTSSVPCLRYLEEDREKPNGLETVYYVIFYFLKKDISNTLHFKKQT
jgi:hypothetical protein